MKKGAAINNAPVIHCSLLLDKKLLCGAKYREYIKKNIGII